MKNTASVFNDGECVYFYSKIKIGVGTKIYLILINLFFVFIITLILSSIKLNGKQNLVVIVLPVLYIFSLGRISLWNFFGEEQIIINTNSIVHNKNFGLFTTSFKTIQFKKLKCVLNQEKEFNNIPFGTISFLDKTQLDVPIVIFSSSIYVPIQVLVELENQLEFVFCIEHLAHEDYDIIHLN